MNDILRIGRGGTDPERKTYSDVHVSELGIITLPLNIYQNFEDEVRGYTQRYLADIAGMFNDLQALNVEMAKVSNLDVKDMSGLSKNLNGLWYEQSKVMYHIHATYTLLGTSTIPSMLLPKSIVRPDSKAFFIDQDKQTAIPANLHMFNQDAYFYHIGGIGYKTYLFIDEKIEFI